MNKKFQILISCYSGEKDSGDETMLLCVREQLTKALGQEIELKAFSNNPKISDDFNENIEFIYSGRHGLKQPEESGRNAYRWIGKMLRAIRECDILITGGGTILYDESNRFFVPFWFLKIAIAQIMKKPTAFYGIGVGPLTRTSSKLLMRIFGTKMNFISLRGVESLKWMKKFPVPKEKVYLTADPAVTIYPADDSKVSRYLESQGICLGQEDEYIVLVAREWFRRKNRGLEAAMDGTAKVSSYEDYIEQLTGFVRYIIEKENKKVLLMPMGTLPPCDDREVLDSIYNKITANEEYRNKIYRMDDIADSRVMVGIIAKSEAVVTGRFHGLIYATSQYVPALALAYTEKYYDYYNYIGLGQYVIDMDDLDCVTLTANYCKMIQNQDKIKERLMTEIPKQIELAMKNANMVADILRR